MTPPLPGSSHSLFTGPFPTLQTNPELQSLLAQCPTPSLPAQLPGSAPTSYPTPRPHTPPGAQFPLPAHRDIPGPEEELAVEVGFLNGVHVGDSDATTCTAAQPQHCKVLEQLAANGPSPHLPHIGEGGATSAGQGQGKPCPCCFQSCSQGFPSGSKALLFLAVCNEVSPSTFCLVPGVAPTGSKDSPTHFLSCSQASPQDLLLTFCSTPIPTPVSYPIPIPHPHFPWCQAPHHFLFYSQSQVDKHYVPP